MFQKKPTKTCACSQEMCQYLRPKNEIPHWETKKTNLVLIPIKRQKKNWYYSQMDLSFLFVIVLFDFEPEFFRDWRHIHFEHSHFYLAF